MLSRAEVDSGLRLWRQAVDQAESTDVAMLGLQAGLSPWLLEIQAAAVIAHAQHGRLDLVEDMTAVLPGRLATMLADTGRHVAADRHGRPGPWGTAARTGHGGRSIVAPPARARG